METEFQVHAIALKTLKQRCEYLQERLNAVEEENCKLKMEKAQDLNKRSYSKNSTSDLEEQIVILNEEKSQMAHQIKIISSENLALWSQLSELMPGADVSLQDFAISNSRGNQVSKFTPDVFDDYGKESLEEISLKLINGILLSKNELDKQYSQMIDLQKGGSSDVKNVGYALKQFDKRSVLKNLKDHVQKLKDIKQALYQQKTELSNGITVLKNLEVLPRHNTNVGSGDNVHYRNENSVSVIQCGREFLNSPDGRTMTNGEDATDNATVCPLCGVHFTGLLNDFYKHVCDHFSEENDEFVDANAYLDGP